MTSPKGDSGLTTDSGEQITYPDSYFFIMQKKADSVTNYTVKTNFTHQESREVIYRLTGKRLPVMASIEEYVEAVAAIKPGESEEIQSVSDVVGVLEKVRSTHAFKNSVTQEKTGWEDVYKDILQGERLYQFNEKTQQMIADFEVYCLQEGLTKHDLQKAIAATILRMSQLYYTEEAAKKQRVILKPDTWYKPNQIDVKSFGSILNAIAEQPGCAGGGGASGKTVVVNSVTPRLGVVDSEKISFGEKTLHCKNCPVCGVADIDATISNGRIKCPVNGCSAPYAC